MAPIARPRRDAAGVSYRLVRVTTTRTAYAASTTITWVPGPSQDSRDMRPASNSRRKLRRYGPRGYGPPGPKLRAPGGRPRGGPRARGGPPAPPPGRPRRPPPQLAGDPRLEKFEVVLSCTTIVVLYRVVFSSLAAFPPKNEAASPRYGRIALPGGCSVDTLSIACICP